MTKSRKSGGRCKTGDGRLGKLVARARTVKSGGNSKPVKAAVEFGRRALPKSGRRSRLSAEERLLEALLDAGSRRR